MFAQSARIDLSRRTVFNSQVLLDMYFRLDLYRVCSCQSKHPNSIVPRLCIDRVSAVNSRTRIKCTARDGVNVIPHAVLVATEERRQ